MEDLAVFTALNHSGSFGKNLIKFKNNKNLIYRLRVGPYGEKLRPQSWKCCPRSTTWKNTANYPYRTLIEIYHISSVQFPCTSVLKMLPSAHDLRQYFQDLDHSFSPYGPPSRQISYISSPDFFTVEIVLSGEYRSTATAKCRFQRGGVL